MKKLLHALLLVPFLCHGQGDQTIIKVPIDANGDTFNAILHLPNDYTSTGTAYPLMMFFHGAGEGGANPASIYTSSTAGGPAYFIAQGTFPSSFVNPKDGQSYKYIVVSPQANPEGVQGSTTGQEADYILTYLYAHYRIDTTRVYFTGLSDGGETCLEYLGGTMSNGGNFLSFHHTHHVAAIIPMSENGIITLMPEAADTIVADGIGGWAFGSTDEQGLNTLRLAQTCNQLKPGSMISTSYVGGHCCWGQFYNPTFSQNGMSIYQWALQYKTQVATPTAAVGSPIPGTIQASTYDTASAGVKTQATTDSAGGLNVGWINTGSWMDYAVDVAAAGTYKASFRVAALYKGAAFQVRNAGGTVLGTVTVPMTSGFQVWTTVSTYLTLPAGSQTLQLFSTGTTNWNIHWMEFTDTSSSLALAVTPVLDTASGVVVYPNPVRSSFTLGVTNAHTGSMTIELIDLYGAVRRQLVVQKNWPSQTVNIDATGLSAGVYICRVRIGAWSAVKKLVKE
ncbi:carbohydrate-binding protein [Dinghuibacter silviterrae]|uniref:Putative secreted protein (Por secretion system target) n=1 Tax=Dinghuibacter silviterrae TaxID=1539049 RepID=A0A4V3GM48_9BACT|nr:carbohydrate-binding protein [Dinghuibacter silviterrae]TDX02063.1 putative secreted protein (Por secretion system target) [Dinghuibacter silviterrae]